MSESSIDLQLLSEINHYKQFPSMMPHIGVFYSKFRILVIAESHYFPKDSSIHKTAGTWYKASDKDLTEKEQGYINTQKLLRKKWNSPGHNVLMELNRAIADGLNLPRKGEVKATEYVAYMNAFQRPGETGMSLKKSLTDVDKAIGLQTVMEVLKLLNPRLVIFTSILAWNRIGKQLDKNYTKFNIHATYHPAAYRYWHGKKYKKGRRKFVELVRIQKRTYAPQQNL
jgi:hypothetical protein